MMNHEVPIDLTSRHEHVSERMKDYALEKATKLLRFHNRISRIQVIVDGVHEDPDVEMIVHVDSGATLVAKEHRSHFKSAIDLIVDKMERQLKKNKEKRKHHKGANGGRMATGAPLREIDLDEPSDDESPPARAQ
jgi:putative sigma-54 modulation protein